MLSHNVRRLKDNKLKTVYNVIKSGNLHNVNIILSPFLFPGKIVIESGKYQFSSVCLMKNYTVIRTIKSRLLDLYNRIVYPGYVKRGLLVIPFAILKNNSNYQIRINITNIDYERNNIISTLFPFGVNDIISSYIGSSVPKTIKCYCYSFDRREKNYYPLEMEIVGHITKENNFIYANNYKELYMVFNNYTTPISSIKLYGKNYPIENALSKIENHDHDYYYKLKKGINVVCCGKSKNPIVWTIEQIDQNGNEVI
jgi:hypothetical protein